VWGSVPAILGIRFAFDTLYFFRSALRVAHDIIRPAHLGDINQALLIRGKLFVCFADIHDFLTILNTIAVTAMIPMTSIICRTFDSQSMRKENLPHLRFPGRHSSLAKGNPRGIATLLYMLI
jgi:hypothetical protein